MTEDGTHERSCAYSLLYLGDMTSEINTSHPVLTRSYLAHIYIHVYDDICVSMYSAIWGS